MQITLPLYKATPSSPYLSVYPVALTLLIGIGHMPKNSEERFVLTVLLISQTCID